MFVYRITILILAVLHQSASQVNLEPMITLTHGKIRGRVNHSRDGRKYVSFLGIPYASTPPRFKLGGPVKSWDGVRDGTIFGPRCPQYNRETDSVVGDEDCLFLNVYTPVGYNIPRFGLPSLNLNYVTYSTPNQGLLPVMVYIHGGYFMEGSGNDYNPEYFMDEDVIIVTFNYRLGVFGFLTTVNKNLIPNLGMKDQVAALTWVKWNIAKFGGDSNRITIFGSGAGAASVSYHLISRMSQGLFNSAISQSGTALCPWALVRNPYDVAVNFAKRLDCSTANSFSIAACLKASSSQEIVYAQHAFSERDPDHASTLAPFGPVTESILHSMDTGPMFLADVPMKLFREGKTWRVPWLLGVNSDDGVTLPIASLLNATNLANLREKSWDHVAPLVFFYKGTAPSPSTISQKVKAFYFGAGKRQSDDKWKEQFATALSDRNFFRCTKSAALLYALNSPVWVYVMEHKSNFSLLDKFNLGLRGTFHGDETQHFFQTPFFPRITKTSADYAFSKSVVKTWVTFASKGYPHRRTSDDKQWSPLPPATIGPDTTITMCNISTDSRIIQEPFFPRLQFWDKLRLLSPQSQLELYQNPSKSEQDPQGQQHRGSSTNASIGKLTGIPALLCVLSLPYFLHGL